MNSDEETKMDAVAVKGDAHTRVVTHEPSELERRIARALDRPQFRLTTRVAQALGLDEALVQRVLSQVPLMVPRIEREKRAETERVKAEYRGEVQKLRYQARHEAEARHDSRVRHRKPGLNSATGVKPMVQL